MHGNTNKDITIIASPLFLLLLEELDPETEESVVRVVTLLLPLLFDLKLKPDLPLWKELVLLFLKRLPPLLVLLRFLWARLWLLLSLRLRLSDMEEAWVVLDLPMLILLFLRISWSLWVTVGCLTAVVWCLLRPSSGSISGQRRGEETNISGEMRSRTGTGLKITTSRLGFVICVV